jgi:hypothetical protein
VCLLRGADWFLKCNSGYCEALNGLIGTVTKLLAGRFGVRMPEGERDLSFRESVRRDSFSVWAAVLSLRYKGRDVNPIQLFHPLPSL